jgi:hypothetical protein
MSNNKVCKRCGENNQKEFYSGYSGICKTCKRKDVSIYRKKNLKRIRLYDRLRGNRQKKEYLESKEYKSSHLKANQKWRLKNKEKVVAYYKVGNAIRYRKIKKENCRICNKKASHAHHYDYSKPLDVFWLCSKHHRLEHFRRKNIKEKKP